MSQRYRWNDTGNMEASAESGKWIDLLTHKPTQDEVRKAVKKAGIVRALGQIEQVIIQDYLPAWWPDRITVRYRDNEQKQVTAIFVRIRKD